MISPISQTALQGIKSATERAVQYAQNVSTAYQDNGDGEIIDDIIGLRLAQYDFQANAKVIKVDQRMQDSILDILA